MEPNRIKSECRPDPVGNGRSFLRILKVISKVAFGVATAVVLVAIILTEIAIPRRANLPPAMAAPAGGHAFYYTDSLMRDLLASRYLFGLYAPYTDGLAQKHESELSVTENGKILGPAHQAHSQIREDGGGAYSNWEGGLILSASDNSDIRTNGRNYEIRTRLHATPRLEEILWTALYAALVTAFGALFVVTISDSRRRWSAALLVAAPACWFLAALTTGILFVGLIMFGFAAAVVGTGWAIGGLLPRRLRLAIESSLSGLALILMSLAFGGMMIEGGLRLIETVSFESGPQILREPAINKNDDPAYEALPVEVMELLAERSRAVTMPDSWKMKPVNVPGAAQAFMWHNALHVADGAGMRRQTPLPAPDPSKFRIIVIGDSLTYGWGIDERWTYPSSLERKLKKKYAVEIINLGIPGLQSADDLRVLKKYYSILQPNLVIYGICLNDFLDSNEGQVLSWSVALPKIFTQNSKIASIAENGLNAAGRSLGLMPTFYSQIIDGFPRYEKRFASDLNAMNEFVTAKGAPPIVATVLDQNPNRTGRKLANAAEAAARRAGMNVISADYFYTHYDGRSFAVSTWEGHPNEWANEIFAERLYNHINGCCGMQKFPN